MQPVLTTHCSSSMPLLESLFFPLIVPLFPPGLAMAKPPPFSGFFFVLVLFLLPGIDHQHQDGGGEEAQGGRWRRRGCTNPKSPSEGKGHTAPSGSPRTGTGGRQPDRGPSCGRCCGCRGQRGSVSSESRMEKNKRKRGKRKEKETVVAEKEEDERF